MLLAAVAAGGSHAVDGGVVEDTREALLAAIEKAISGGGNADAVLTSGGVSMGDRDFVKPVFEELCSRGSRRTSEWQAGGGRGGGGGGRAGGQVHFGRVLMKPGKPLTFATVPSPEVSSGTAGPAVLLFGLPGNPVSALTTFNLVCGPALRAMAGSRKPLMRRVSVVTDCALPMDPARPEYHRARVKWVGDTLVASSTGNQISSRLLSMHEADVLVEVPRGSGQLPVGTVMPALVLSDLRTGMVDQSYCAFAPLPVLPDGTSYTSALPAASTAPASPPLLNLTTLPEAMKVQCEAFAFSKLMQHLQIR
jgi:gephyrin